MVSLLPFSPRSLGISLLLVSLSLSCASAQNVTSAQQAACDRYHETQLCLQLVNEFYAAHALLSAGQFSPLDQPWTDTVAFAHKMAPKAILDQLTSDLKTKAGVASQEAQRALQTVSTSAAVTQVGGPASTGGSTNLVTKPTTTDLISLAAESGAFTDTLNGTGLTLQANALGLTKYLGNQAVFERWNSKFADQIQPLNFSVTLNVAQSGSSTATTSGSANDMTPSSITSVLLPSNNASFSSFGVTYSLYRPYNPQNKTFLDNWKKAVAANKSALNTAGSAIAVAVNNLITPAMMQTILDNLSTPLADWHRDGAAAERNGSISSFDSFVSAYSIYEDAVADYVLSRPDGPKNVLALSNALEAFNTATYTVLDQARGTPLATISYTYSAPVQQPATNNGTVVVSYLFKGDPDLTTGRGTFLSGAQLTANFTAAVYASLPAGAKYGRFRDVQASAEFDKPIGGSIAAPRATLSIAGYGQYQYDPTVLNIAQGNLVPGTDITLPSNAQVLLGTSGWIGVAQGKLAINLSKGLTIPIAVKWSNKTNLLSGSDTRGQIGLSYDLSALSKLISHQD
jgi:hypothetical protein